MFRHSPLLTLAALMLCASLPLWALPVAAQTSGGLTATLTAAPATVAVNQTVRVGYKVPPYAGSASGGLTTSSLDFGDGISIDAGSVGPGETIAGDVAHAYAGPGTYTITFAAQAPDGETASATAMVTVVDQLQPPAIVLHGPSGSVQPGDAVSFSYSITPSSGAGVAAIGIDYGDGSTDTLSAPSGTVSHTYIGAGDYAVLMVATDGNGQSGAASTVAQVGP